MLKKIMARLSHGCYSDNLIEKVNQKKQKIKIRERKKKKTSLQQNIKSTDPKLDPQSPHTGSSHTNTRRRGKGWNMGRDWS